MRYLVIREKDKTPSIMVWDGEKTHLHMIKEKKIRQQDISSVGYVLYERASQDFKITWHTPYADEPDERQDLEDKSLLMQYMRSRYGQDKAIQDKMADELEEQIRKSEEIRRQFFQKTSR